MRYKVTVPATSANLGPGFDAIGLALSLRNEFIFEEMPAGLRITVQGEGLQSIPTDETNLVYQAAQHVFERCSYRPNGLKIEINNRVPAASGMGSSSTAIVGGLLGANALAGSPYTQYEILQMATFIEGHPDNVMPAIYGGLTIGVIDGSEVIPEPIDVPDMQVVIVMPHYDISTEEARAALPSVVPLSDVVFNLARVALLVRALESADYGRLRVAMQDKLHQPYRMSLIPGLSHAFEAAMEAGAAGVALSGAGPSMIAFAPDNHATIARMARSAYSKFGITSRDWLLQVNRQGATVEEIAPVLA